MNSKFQILNSKLEECGLCPRLVAWREQVGREKRKSYENDSYWAKPVPIFGDPNATRLIVGLAPAAHGANRTGRMFHGDRSGDWLYRALHKAGVAKLAKADSIEDGQELYGVMISAVCHCAPPDNKPLPEEIKNCGRYLAAVLGKSSIPSTPSPLSHDSPPSSPWRSILCLGSIAWNEVHRNLGTKKTSFGHGAVHEVPGLPKLVASYHPSQQNTFTGKLTESMLDAAVAEWLL